MTGTREKIGIIAGGGQLPVMLAESCLSSQTPFFIVALEGQASQEDLQPYPFDWSAMGTAGKLFDLLKSNECTKVVMAGKVGRPDFRSMKLDWRGSKILPTVIKRFALGDDSLFKAIVDIFEKEGFEVIGLDSLLEELVAPEGVLGKVIPSEQDEADIERAKQVAQSLGKLDIGQGAVICNQLVLAVEAAEGTDKMLERCASLPENVRGTPQSRRGVLLKMPKPEQERRVDLPTIGVNTVELCQKAGLSGIAIAAGGSLIVDRVNVIQLADKYGMFIKGV